MGAASSTLEAETVSHATIKETQWRQLIIRSLKGEPDKDLAQAFGVQVGTIRQRRYSDPVWSAAQEQIKAVQKATVKTTLTKPDSPLSLSDISSIHPESVAKFAHRMIEYSIEHDLIPMPSSISEFKMLVEIVRKSCGLDTPQTNVQLNLWSGSSASPAPSITAEVEIVSQETQNDWI
jgi:hypothetical protein